MTGLKNGAHLGLLPVHLFSLHVGEVKTYTWHKTLYDIWVLKIFLNSIIFVKEMKRITVLAYYIVKCQCLRIMNKDGLRKTYKQN